MQCSTIVRQRRQAERPGGFADAYAAVMAVGASARSRLEGAGKSALLAFDPTVRTRTEGAVLLAEGDMEGASGKLREAYATLESEWSWGNESTMAEIRRLCLARGLGDPGGGGDFGAS